MQRSRQFRGRGRRFKHPRMAGSTLVRDLFSPADIINGTMPNSGGGLSGGSPMPTFHREEGRLPHRPARAVSGTRGR